MSGSWNIDVGAAAATIRATAEQAQSVEPAIAGLEEALQLALSSIPGGPVVAALNDVVANSLGPNAKEALSRTGSIVSSTIQAVSFYSQGDLEMASNSQRNLV